MLPTLSCLSVRRRPVTCLRNRCSERYLRISPLHRPFRPLYLLSRQTVSEIAPKLSSGISSPTYLPAYTPFTPSKSGQRLPPTYYRGCWHVVSRGLFCGYRQCATHSPFLPRQKQFTTQRAFVLHAAWLGQAFAHCPIFPTAASRRSLVRISVPVWGPILSEPLKIVALVSHYLTN